jgi:GNAT superfamily N-acetyltransferase
MNLIAVVDTKSKKQFLEVPISIYQNDPNWVRPLDNDIEAVFDPAKNKLFESGDAIRWILKDESGKGIGRVAAFVNEKTARTSEYVTGGLGFFECINNQAAANILFDACKKWLSERGMEAMDGPINFGDRQSWWGLLVEGFYVPTYTMNYNPAYYQPLFENFGFQTYFNQFVYNYEISRPVPEIFWEKSRRVINSPAFRFENIKKTELKKYAEDLTIVYNEAWSKMGHFKPTRVEQSYAALKKMLPVMDERIVWFGYFKERPIACFIMLPDINLIVRHLNGKLNWWGKLKFFYYLKTGEINRVFGVIFGVVPDFQGKGIDGAIVIEAAKVIQQLKQYQNCEMNWVGDFNPKMVKMVENLGTTLHKKYKTYRLIFDPSKPFSRAPQAG